MDAGNLLMRLGVAEDKVTEPHVLLHQLAQVHAQLLGVLVHETEAFRLRLLAVLALGTFQYQRQVFIPLPDGMQEPQAGVGHFLSAHGKTGIADDTKRIVSEPLIKRHRLLVVTGQHHLGSAPHAQSRRVAIECLLREILALGQDVTIQVWQYAAIETYGVFHQQYHLHASLLDIVLQVHLVLYQLDDGKNKVGIAQPAEHVVENREVFVLHALGDAMGKRGEHHARDVRELLLDIPGHIESVVVRRARHANHQVHLHGTQCLGRLLYGGGLGESGGITQSQLHVLIVDLLLYASVIFEHEGIIGVGHYQHAVYPAQHQVDEGHVFQHKLTPLLRLLIFHT